MVPLFSEHLTPLDDILFEDLTYLITTDKDKDAEPLYRSIAEVGLLCPPILLPLTGGACRIVTGFRRLAAVRGLNMAAVPCRLLAPATSDLTCLKIAISDNTRQRALNSGEQARAVDKLFLMMDGAALFARVAAELGLPSTPAAVDKLRAIHALPAAVFDSVADGRLAFSTALSLTRMDTPTATALARLFIDLKLGVNRQREALTLIEEIAAAEDLTCLNILTESSVQEIAAAVEADRGWRCEQLFAYLHGRRFPHISRAEASFAAAVKSLRPGPSARLSHPPDFEGRDYTLTLTFRNRKELEGHMAFLQRIVASDLIDKKP